MTTQHVHVSVRLAVLAAVLVLVSLFACRPAWSPDGKRLLFPCRLGEHQLGIAQYERDSGKTQILFAAPGQGAVPTPLFLPDGEGALIVCADKDRPDNVRVVTLGGAGRTGPTTTQVDVGENAGHNLLAAPVLLGRRLFLSGRGVIRLDLDTGAVVRNRGDERQFVVARRGQGVCYAAVAKGTEYSCELGTVDPETLQLLPFLKVPTDSRWHVLPMPAFTRDLRRVALPAHAGEREEEAAILVFADGKLETVLPIGHEGDVAVGNVEWLPDGAALCASLCRRNAEDGTVQCLLLETTIGGSVTRETPLVRTSPANDDLRQLSLSLPVALSPDGHTAALSTALLEHLDDRQHGLYLVDLNHKQRAVTRVPFPAPHILTIKGSDVLLDLASGWASGVAAEHPERQLAVAGGGSSVGLRELVQGNADLAMTSRPASPAELAAAKAAGVELVAHPFAFDALAICVHKDNPIVSLTMAQLAEIFGENGATQWAEVGVAWRSEPKGMLVLPPDDHTPTFAALRSLVLTQRRARVVPIKAETADRNLVALVAANPNAITCVGLAYCDERVKVVPIAGKSGAAACLPDATTVTDGSYPLAQRLFVYSLANAKPEVLDLLAWLGSEAGKQATVRAGRFPGR
ncbi:MAG TPA: substrate-binding domain-containing protein [Planctomycetota bacterium]|nr:substrate-binding domain-containing protein [Planctomycetota bacterium]